MDNTLSTILNNTFTLTQLKHRVRILKSYLLKALFGGEIEPLSTADLNWLKSLPTPFYQQFNKDNTYQILAELENNIQKIIPLIIYLPFETDDQAILNISIFVRQTFNQPSLVLDIKYDPNLIAGCALSWKGVYKDYSLRARIEERKGETLESFKKFLR